MCEECGVDSITPKVESQEDKKEELTDQDLEEIRGRVVQEFEQALCSLIWLALPGTASVGL